VNIQLTHLQTLAAVARHGSFSRAARELRLTQPAVSMQVRQLENELGVALLERVGKRSYTTKAGELLLAHAGRAMQELERGLELVQQLRGIVAGRIRLGTSASFSIYLLPSALRKFRARYPQTELVVVTGNAPEITRAVVANELDVGIVSLPVRERELAVTALHRDELVAIGPPDRRWPRRRATATELAKEPLILFEQGATLRRVIDDWFQRGGAAPALPMELGNTEAIKKLVEAGLGLSVTSWFAAKPEVRGAPAQRGEARAAALSPDWDRAATRQAEDAGARRLPRHARRPQALTRLKARVRVIGEFCSRASNLLVLTRGIRIGPARRSSFVFLCSYLVDNAP
jgi:DNA-binding transcriptional LysR family regulator